MQYPTRPTPPGGFLLLLAVVAVGMLLFGGLLLYVSFGQPPEKQVLAMDARSAGIKVIGTSVLLGAATWFGKRFIG